LVAVGGETAVEAVVGLITKGVADRLVITVPDVPIARDRAVPTGHFEADRALFVLGVVRDEGAVFGGTTLGAHGPREGAAGLDVLARAQ